MHAGAALPLSHSSPRFQVWVVLGNFREPLHIVIPGLKSFHCFFQFLFPQMQHRLQTIEYRIETNLLHIPYAGTQSIDCQTLTPVSLTPTVWFFWGLQPSCKWPLFLALNSLTLKKGGKPVKRKIAWPRPMSSSWCLCPGKGKEAKTGWGEGGKEWLCTTNEQMNTNEH